MGEDKSGMVVTVASAIARSGIDPWEEAARLAALSPGAAAQVLMPMIARSSETVDPGDARAMADRLVRLLPKWVAAAQVGRSAWKLTGRPPATVWVVCLLMAVGFLVWTLKEKSIVLDEGPAGIPSSGDASRNR